jgi:pimeloyl-ACP methyl ester carboxylesterase
MADMRSSVLFGDLMACDEFDITAQLEKIHQPALVLCGAADQMTPPKYSEYLHTHLSGSRLRLLNGAGHMVMLEQPEEVAGALAAFLDSIPYEPGR